MKAHLMSALCYGMAGTLLGSMLICLIVRHSHAFRRWLGSSQCCCCDQPPREGKFTCYKHAGFEEEQA